jgi:hypothetical protein
MKINHSTNWTADKQFVLALGSNFLEELKDNNDIYVLGSGLDKITPQEDFQELKGKRLKVFFGFDAPQQFEDERVFELKPQVEYANVGGLTMLICLHKGKIFRIVLSRTYKKKINKDSFDWIKDILESEYFLGSSKEKDDKYIRWSTQYTDIELQNKKAHPPFFVSELMITATSRVDIDKFPDVYDDQDAYNSLPQAS